ncbi:hypothetical protein PAXINDRAFT_180973 [Paxillus involutus ATCC 200175]|uniref:Uncharacterized protein n=1 Tax=Paxillus involutus ATCC 200175 TaxID=664439 RepID=A0A0C9U4H7_PAXIN|nr:hypothetical protein PAXINDRAFT_180973 [Paxillus involutus ATCC 200175]
MSANGVRHRIQHVERCRPESDRDGIVVFAWVWKDTHPHLRGYPCGAVHAVAADLQFPRARHCHDYLLPCASLIERRDHDCDVSALCKGVVSKLLCPREVGASASKDERGIFCKLRTPAIPKCPSRGGAVGLGRGLGRLGGDLNIESSHW